MEPAINLDAIYTWLRTEGLQLLIIIGLMFVGIWLANKLAVWLAAVLVTKEDEDPKAKRRMEGLATFLKYFFSAVVLLIAGLALLSQLALVDLDLVYAWTLDSGAQILLTIALMVFGLWLTAKLAGRLAALLMWKHGEDIEMKKRAQTLANFVKYLLSFLIIITGGMMLMGELGFEIRPILASAGVVGLAVGFGAQNLVQDVISGFFILLDDQIRVGDVVNLKGKGGFVEKVGLRMIVMRDFDGTVHYVRNGQIDIVSNLTKDFSCYVFDLRVPYGVEVGQINTIFKAVDEEMRADATLGPLIMKPLELYGVDKLDESWMIVRARVTTKPLQQWNVGRAMNGKIAEHFKRHGLTFAFPKRYLELSNTSPELGAPAREPAPGGERKETSPART